MSLEHHILTTILLIPLLGAILLALLPDRASTQRTGALVVTLITFLFTLHLPGFTFHLPGDYESAVQTHTFRFVEDISWIASPAIHYHLGIDALSMWLIVLTGLLAPLGVLASWRVTSIEARPKTFYVTFLLQQVAMLGLFSALDLFLFYGFFELSLVPMTILIATFGRTKNRRNAAIKYFVYNFVPSALLLVGIVWLYVQTGTFDMPRLAHLATAHQIPGTQTALWLCSLSFLLAFAVKVPIFPLHGWLKDAIVEAPTAAVMILAGKTGFYAILRFSFAIFPDQSHRIAPLMIALGALGIVFGALIAITRKDLKELAAYSTLSHLSFITLGIFSFTIAGLDGGIYQILNHGISGGALFLLLGFLYERYGTYDMRDYGGLAGKLPWMVTMFVVVTLSVIGLPGLNSFVGEFLILSGSMQGYTAHHVFWTAFATTGVIFAAGYMLVMIQRVFYGNLGVVSASRPGIDLNAREHTSLWPLIACMVAMGVASPYWLRTIDTNGTAMTTHPVPAPAAAPTHIEAETYGNSTQPVFLDPELGAAAQHKPAPKPLPGARY